MSLSLEHPANPHMSYMGMYAMGAPGIGFNMAGRLTTFYATNDGNNVIVGAKPEAIHEDITPHVKGFYNADYYTEKISLRATLSRLTPRSDIIFDAIALPEGAAWRNYPGPFPTAIKRDLLVTWDGDPDTERYRVFHSVTVAHSDSIVCASRAANSVITVTNTTGTLAEITVTGVDGSNGPEGDYTINIYHLTEDGDIYLTVTDNVESTTTGTITWDGYQVNFGRGLTMVLTEPWPDVGMTTFTVVTEPDRSFLLKNPTDATHYFKVRAIRDSDNTYAETDWDSKSIVNPPGPVSDINVVFVSTTSVNVTFTMPSDVDIAGYYIFLTEYGKPTVRVPHWFPKAHGTAGPSESVTALVGGLTAGRVYFFYVRAFDSSGLDDETTNVTSFFLSSTGVAYGVVSQPYDITAEATALEEVTVTVTTDRAETSINIYWDNGTGTIDWVTPYDTISSSSREDKPGNEYGIYTVTYTGIAAGDYLFGARCVEGTSNDGNTEVYDDVTVFDSNLTAPSSLTITEVASNG